MNLGATMKHMAGKRMVEPAGTDAAGGTRDSAFLRWTGEFTDAALEQGKQAKQKSKSKK